MFDCEETEPPGRPTVSRRAVSRCRPPLLPARTTQSNPQVSAAAAPRSVKARGPHFTPRLSSATREVIGAWLVCLATAVGCFGLLTLAAPGEHLRGGALISLGAAATVAAANADRAKGHRAEAHRYGRC
jgi:hypothetical protein